MKLKYLLLGIVLHIISSSVFAQYLPLISENVLWSHVEIHCLPGYNSYSSRYYAFKNDTVIGETIYQKLYATDSPDQTGWYLWGLYREDTSTGKVWYRSVFPESEGIAYDFSAQVGDTVEIYNPAFSADPIRLIVMEKNSVEIGGILRKQLKMWDPQHIQSEIWIEGIGSLYGIKNSGMSWAGAACGSEELLCYWKAENNLWQNPAFETCFFKLAGRENLPATSPHVSFQITNKTLIVNKLHHTGLLIIYNMLGKEVLRQSLHEAVTLSLTSLSQGFYFIGFVDPLGVSVTKIWLP